MGETPEFMVNYFSSLSLVLKQLFRMPGNKIIIISSDFYHLYYIAKNHVTFFCTPVMKNRVDIFMCFDSF